MRRIHFLRRGLPAALAACLLPLAGLARDDPFAAGVRPTEPLSPEEQQRTFHLPEGFSIELVAAEPEIAKPMNLAFDIRGRLWVSDSVEYPHAAPLDRPGRDAIRVIEDTDGDGRLDRVSLFADGLNIPIGLYPWRNGVVAWSIPHIWWMEDVDGDGRADRKERLYGPLDHTRDTHGMSSSFNRGFDGWLYVTHGFNNRTTLAGSDGHEIRMHSGNVWRGRMDGSRVEHVTHGQVNPFGMAQDPLGDLYTSDCHSMPAWLLLRGAHYPSFGKPHDGLGFCPPILAHSHGSTAIDGVVHHSGSRWPVAYRDNLFIGNVMTSRVNRDVLIETGAGKEAREAEDFIRCDDPWFRPVHMKFGPDGALYIADFYNRIIGHYEVPLDHPGRDRRRGRIWRVSYTGRGPAPGLDNLASRPGDFFRELGSPDLERRLLVLNHLVDEVGEASIAEAMTILDGRTPSNWQQRVGCLWILHRLDHLPREHLEAAARDYSREVRVHAMRVLSEIGVREAWHRGLALAGLADPDANVRRVAAEALARQPHAEHVDPLLRTLAAVGGRDPFLRHAGRIALRNQLQGEGILDGLLARPLSEEDARACADAALAVGTAPAARFLLHCLDREFIGKPEAARAARHVARHGTPGEVRKLPGVLERTHARDLDLQAGLHREMMEGLRERGGAIPDSATGWSRRIATHLMSRAERARRGWSQQAVPGTATTRVPWVLQQRASSDGAPSRTFLSSLSPGGEEHTGILRSPTFRLPATLSFFLAGHDGEPDRERLGRNLVRLRLTGNRTVIAEAAAPRHDTARPVRWNLSRWEGREGHLEIVDAVSAWGYAWIALGRLEPPVVPLPEASLQEQADALVRAAAIAAEHPGPLSEMARAAITNPSLAPLTRARMAGELLRDRPLQRAVAARLADSSLTEEMRNLTAGKLLTGRGSARDPIRDLLAVLPAPGQQALVRDLAAGREGARLVLQAMEENSLSPLLLRDGETRNRLIGHGGAPARTVRELARDLPPEDEKRRNIIRDLLARNARGEGNPERGRRVFDSACRVCHQLGGEGSLTGPQLDGIGNRGVERLLEDILDPDRNLDPAFRTETLTLAGGDVLSALHRRDEGAVSVYALASGEEIPIERASIVSRKTGNRSLMPDNFHLALEKGHIADLIAFLITTGTSP